jgi:hypothetical protein
MFKKIQVTLSIGMLLSVNVAIADATTIENDIIVMAKPNGSLQCDSKQGKSRIEMQRELTEHGISVSAAYCGHYLTIDTACGLPTGQLNIYEITTEQSQIDKARSLGFEDLSSDVLIDKTCSNNALDILVNNNPKNAVKVRTLLANAVTKNMLHTLITEDKSGNFSVCVEANTQTTNAQFQVWANKLRNIQRLANSNVVITPRQTSCLLNK